MNQPAIHTDNGIWERLLDGDQNALYELYTQYYHTLLFIGLKHVPDSGLVKDVIQQQFLYFWEKRGSLMNARNVRSYIIISFLRRLTSDWVKARRTMNLEVAWSCREEEYIESSHEEHLIIKDNHDAISKNLQDVINSLPARQRELIMLKFYEGLSYDEITHHTGLTHRTVYNKIHEALEKMKQRLLQPAIAQGIQTLLLLGIAVRMLFF